MAKPEGVHKHVKKDGPAFSFVNVTHPSQAKDRKAKHQVFSHVMREHLRKKPANKKRSNKGQWLATSNGEGQDSVLSVMLPRTGPEHDNCLCRLGPHFPCAYEPNVNFIKKLPSMRMLGSVNDPFKSVLRLPDPATESEFRHHLCISGQSRLSVSQWWADKTQRDLVALLCAHLAGTVFEDLWASRMPSAAYLSLRQQLIQAVQRELDSAPTEVGDTTTMGLVYLACGDLWYADLPSMVSHRVGADAILRQQGGLAAFGQKTPEVAQALLNKIVLMDVFTEQPSIVDFDTYIPQEISSAQAGGSNPLFWHAGSDKQFENSSRCTPRSFEILSRAHDVIQFILFENTMFLAQRRAAQTLEMLREEPREPGSLWMFTEQERINRVIRYVTVILMISIKERVPISEAVEPASAFLGVTNLLTLIDEALKFTDLSSFWGLDDLWGVLLFCGLILLPVTRHSDDGTESDDQQLRLRNLRTPAMMLAPSMTNGRATPYFESIKTLLRLQRWLDGGRSDSVGINPVHSLLRPSSGFVGLLLRDSQ